MTSNSGEPRDKQSPDGNRNLHGRSEPAQGAGGRPGYGYYFLKPQLVILCVFAAVGVGVILTAGALQVGILRWVGGGIIFYGCIFTLLWFLARFVIPGSRIELARSVVRALCLPADAAVLDIGTGLGLYAIEAAKLPQAGEVKAIDVWDPREIPFVSYFHTLSRPSGHSAEKAKRNAKIEQVEGKIEFLNMDANHLDFPGRHFDAITCAYVLGHLGVYAQGVLREIGRVLKDDGVVAIVDNVRDFTYFFLSTPHLFLLSYLRGSKARRLTTGYWTSLASEAGFKIIRQRRMPGIIWMTLAKSEKKREGQEVEIGAM